MNQEWIDGLISLVTAYGLRVVGAILLLIGGWVVSKYSRRAVSHRLGKTQIDPTLSKFFANTTGTLIMVFVLFAALELFGIKTTSFVAVLGAAGLAVGLALQGTLSNFAAGIMLLIFRPFKVGDVVNVAGQLGKIEAIDLFVTNMDTLDNRRIVIPNSMIFGGVIETITFHPTRRIDISVGTEYSADLDRVRSELEQAASSAPGVLTEPESQVVLIQLGTSSVDWEIRVWTLTSDFLGTKQAVIRGVKKALDDAGIGIPFPQMDVHVDGTAESR